MPDREQPRYRFRGSVKPCAEVSRPVAARRNDASGSSDGGTSNSATLDILDVIDSWGGWWGISARDVDKALNQIGKVDTLYVRLNSPGGEALEGVAIGNLLRAHASTVRITVYGLAASAASAIAMSGDVVNMAPGSMMMIHDAWNIVLGNPADLRAEADVLDKLSDGYAALYAKRAGGTKAQWRDLMRAETWYDADGAVEAKLADAVAVDPALQVTPATQDDPAELLDDVLGFDSAADRFDLTVFAHAPAARATAPTKTPAQPVQPTNTEEADTMSDTIPKAGVIAALGLSGDVDEDAILDAIDERTKAAQARTESADDGKLDPAKVAAALAADGKVVVSQAFLDELKAGATAGREALARQSREDRDKAITQAQNQGKISRDKDAVESWQQAWDRDPQQTAKELDELGVRFPVGPTNGFTGSETQRVDENGKVTDSSDSAVWTEDEAAQLGALAGLPKGALR